jgi:ATP-dependent exoDNAse (exonuclease V) beta subunit
MTLHRAKGLEFDHVLLAGLEEGVWPNWQSEQQGALAEERRLFYVGVTRARHSLQRSWVRHRRDWAGKPSRFLTEIPKALIEGAATALRFADRGTAGRAPASFARSVKPPTQAETDRLVAECMACTAVKAAR